MGLLLDLILINFFKVMLFVMKNKERYMLIIEFNLIIVGNWGKKIKIKIIYKLLLYLFLVF